MYSPIKEKKIAVRDYSFTKVKILSILITCVGLFNAELVSAQIDSISSSVSDKYAHFSNCITDVFMQADHLKLEEGEKPEIKWLEQNRLECEISSPITRRIATRYLEWGDTIYDGKGTKDELDKKEKFKIALQWARKALQEDSTDHLNYETMAMGFAAVISVSGLKGKAHLADSVRIYAEECILINPKNDRAYHILGRWHYEVSKLGWFTRLLSKVIFRENPKGSFEKATDYFVKAIALDNIVVHRYWLGMAYLEKGDKQEALEQFKIIEDLEIVQHNDQYFKDRAKKLIEKHG